LVHYLFATASSGVPLPFRARRAWRRKGTMIPGAFDYHRPADLDEAVRLLAELGEEALIVAVGHSLIPMMKLRMAQPEHLVDLQAIEALRGIRVDGRSVTIGAMTTQAEVIASRELTEVCPILRETSLQIADPQIRNLGTIGGNAANGDPGNDMPAVLQALDARYHLQGADGSREIAARDYYEGIYFTARADGEILTAVSFEAPPAGHGHAYEKQKRKIGDYATAAAAVLLTRSGGTCTHAAIALTNVADRPLYAAEASRALEGTAFGAGAVAAAAAAAEEITEPASDGRGPAAFRTKLTGVMVRRAIARALAGAA
jgi:carbon-monoxide dehydrogenase medium subunit